VPGGSVIQHDGAVGADRGENQVGHGLPGGEVQVRSHRRGEPEAYPVMNPPAVGSVTVTFSTAAAVLRRPAPRKHWCSTACRTADSDRGGRCPTQAQGDRTARQLGRRAAGRPAVTDHPTGPSPDPGPARRTARPVGRPCASAPISAMSPWPTRRSNSAAGWAPASDRGLRVARVRAEGFDLGDRRPGLSRRPRTPPRPPAQRYCSAELLRADRSSSNGSGAPTRYSPNVAARLSAPPGVGPSCQDARHVGRSHSTGDSDLREFGQHRRPRPSRFPIVSFSPPPVTKYLVTVT